MCGVDAAGRATYGLPVRFRPASLASERLMPVVRGSCDDTINVLASCPRIEGPAKRTSGVGSTRVCVTGGESAAFGFVAELVDARRQAGRCWCESSRDHCQRESVYRGSMVLETGLPCVVRRRGGTRGTSATSTDVVLPSA